MCKQSPIDPNALVNQLVSQEEMDSIATFCNEASRQEREAMVVTVRKNLKFLRLDVIEAVNGGAICSHVGAQLTEVIDSLTSDMRRTSDRAKAMIGVLHELMVKARAVKSLCEDTIDRTPMCAGYAPSEHGLS